MKKQMIFSLFIMGLVSLLYGQNTSVTNNNTIIINGNVYYFQPSNTASSPLPRVGNNNFISTGSWYGENAARAWASISDWAIERSIDSTRRISISDNERAHISQVHAYRIIRFYGFDSYGVQNPLTEEARRHGGNIVYRDGATHAITIYYWIVRNGDLMENGRRATRTFIF